MVKSVNLVKMKQKDKDYILFWIALMVITMLLLIGKASAQLPTKTELYAELKKQNVINAKAAFQICMVETGHLKSRIAKEDNNLFGLHNGCSYMQFESWQDCVKYFAKLECKWWDKFSKEHTGDYYDFIAWWGYKTGVSCSVKDIKYSEYLKKIKVK
jgi:nitrite reductase/ring-hydroxylating ferredoxin subunit